MGNAAELVVRTPWPARVPPGPALGSQNQILPAAIARDRAAGYDQRKPEVIGDGRDEPQELHSGIGGAERRRPAFRRKREHTDAQDPRPAPPRDAVCRVVL